MNLRQINKLDKEQLFKDPVKHREVLYDFKDIVKEMILGVEDIEWRSELEFLLERTNLKISEVSNAINAKKKSGIL